MTFFTKVNLVNPQSSRQCVFSFGKLFLLLLTINVFPTTEAQRIMSSRSTRDSKSIESGLLLSKNNKLPIVPIEALLTWKSLCLRIFKQNTKFGVFVAGMLPLFDRAWPIDQKSWYSLTRLVFGQFSCHAKKNLLQSWLTTTQGVETKFKKGFSRKIPKPERQKYFFNEIDNGPIAWGFFV